jgi:hypothetical protein
MNFQIRGLHEGQFSHLFGKDSQELAEAGVERMTVDSKPGFPCRVSLQDAEFGETVLLTNFEHQPALSPYRSSHAIFVREGAATTGLDENVIPEMLRIRLISVRAFNVDGNMVDADITSGQELEALIHRMLSCETAAYLHVHNAKRGCFLARVDRA